MNYKQKELLKLIGSYELGCVLTNEKIAEELQVSRTTAALYVKKLYQTGHITKETCYVNKKKVRNLKCIK
jgi:DNA-binding Lrp family transcriptional regulator